MTDEQIRSYFADEPRFGGVYANDEMPLPVKGKCYIINLENESEGGSHWTALCNGFYFDSYGEVPTKNVMRYVTKNNSSDFQGLAQQSCGYYAMYACVNFMKHRSPSFGLLPNKYRHNESVLKKFFF